MRIFHISDLHIGKQLHYYNLYDCQKKALEQIVVYADEYKPDAILISGDVYDRSVPSGEAYTLFDSFLMELSKLEGKPTVLIIAGNHDNAQRLQYASGFFAAHNIYISTMPPRTEEEQLMKVSLPDEFGEVNFYLLPFMKPGYVRQLFEEGEIIDYDSAIRAVIEREAVDYSQRNVLLAHQFFVSEGKEPETSDSELKYISIGGLDSVDVSCVRQFDYVALGHIHRSQRIGEDYIRYSGTPYKYSVSEEHDTKGVLMVSLGEKGEVPEYETLPIVVTPDVRSIRGTLETVLEAATEENKDDYVSITLTDENVFQAKEKLEEKYSHILEVRVDNQRTRKHLEETVEEIRTFSPMEAFIQFYKEINDCDMSEEEEEILKSVIEEAQDSLL